MTTLIVALDVATLEEQAKLLDTLSGTVSWFKIGLQLYTAHGWRAIDAVRKRGGKVFLDLKLHDIPKTVELAVAETQKLGVDAVSLHLMGGAAMVRAAASVFPRPALWGVTVLTSATPADVKIFSPATRIPALVKALAKLGRQNGADATICSPQEAAVLKKTFAKSGMTLVTPGIRPPGAALNDQARVMTPRQAAALGINFVVVGRPITHAPDPRRAALDILAEMKNS